MFAGTFELLETLMPRPFALIIALALELIGAFWVVFFFAAIAFVPVGIFSHFFPASPVGNWLHHTKLFEVLFPRRDRKVASVAVLSKVDWAVYAAFWVAMVGLLVRNICRSFFPDAEAISIRVYFASCALVLAVVVVRVMARKVMRRFPGFAATIGRAVSIIKFCLWGWTQTVWGLRLGVVAGAVLWFKIFELWHDTPVAAGLSAISLAVLYFLGKGVAKLDQVFAAREWRRLRSTLGVLMDIAKMITVGGITVGAGSTSQTSARPMFIGLLFALSIVATVRLGWGVPSQPQGRKYGDAEVVSGDILKAKGVIDER
jgi:hypothetical protein